MTRTLTKCPYCKKEIVTSKKEKIQCKKCGKRFDL